MRKSVLEQKFDYYLRIYQNSTDTPLPTPKEEHRFHPTRKWRFDRAWPAYLVAVEIDGGQWLKRGGRHNTDKDRWKLNEAAALGWRVLRFSGTMLDKNPFRCMGLIKAALDQAKELSHE